MSTPKLHATISVVEQVINPFSISHHTDVGWLDNTEYLFLFEKHTHTYIGEGGWDKGIHSHAKFKLIDYYIVLLLVLRFVWASIHVFTSNLASPKYGLPTLPHPFVIIGNTFELGNLPHQAIAKLYKTYRPFKILKLGCITTIVISSQNIAKEALQNYPKDGPNFWPPQSFNGGGCLQILGRPWGSASWHFATLIFCTLHQNIFIKKKKNC